MARAPGSVLASGVATHGRPANRPRRPASTPASAVPAIGWLATKRPCSALPALQHRLLDRAHIGDHRIGRQGCQQLRRGLEQPIEGQGQHDQPAALQHGGIDARSPVASWRWRARSAVLSRCTRARTSSPAACRSSPSDPPISPRPTMPTGRSRRAARILGQSPWLDVMAEQWLLASFLRFHDVGSAGSPPTQGLAAAGR